MLRVIGTATIACPPETLLAFVMDIQAYAEVDTKIQPILWSRRTGDLVGFACRPVPSASRCSPRLPAEVRSELALAKRHLEG